METEPTPEQHLGYLSSHGVDVEPILPAIIYFDAVTRHPHTLISYGESPTKQRLQAYFGDRMDTSVEEEDALFIESLLEEEFTVDRSKLPCYPQWVHLKDSKSADCVLSWSSK